MSTIIGIDPGLRGAVAVVSCTCDEMVIYLTPTIGAKEYDEPAMYKLMKACVRPYTITTSFGATEHCLPARAYIEHAQAFPAQGRSSAFKIGLGVGLWRMVCTALDIPKTIISPAKWQRVMFAGVPKQDTKIMSIIAANRLFPGVSLRRTDKSRVDDHNMADALLIAEYGRRQMNGC